MSQKIAYVTGGMGGIGTAICQRMHQEGFKVIAGCGPTRDHAKWLAEQSALGDPRAEENLKPPERDALAFPARLLRRANADADSGDLRDFSELAREVGRSKTPYNDQR